jgi:hypothetical protein
MKCPSEIYIPSAKRYEGLPEIDYAFHDRISTITCCGRIWKKINVSKSLQDKTSVSKKQKTRFGW